VGLDDAREFVASNHRAVLVTRRSGGGLQTSPVLVGVDGEGKLVVSTREGAYKTRNLRRDPTAVLCVFSDGFFGRWMQLEGRAQVVSLPGAMEGLVDYYRRISGIHYVSLRYGNVYGPRQDPEGEAGVVAIFTQKMLNGEQPVINGNGRQTRDFIYVDDVVEANLAVMGKEVEGIYNVGTSEETSVNELFRLLAELTKSGCKELHGPAKKGEQVRSVIDTRKLRQELGWDPRMSLREGLARTVEYFRGEKA